MTSQDARKEVVEALRLDLVGPDNDHLFARELLPDPPSRWYLSGFLVPRDAPEDQKADETAADEIASGGDTDGSDDAQASDRDTARKSFLPSSMGLSVLVPPEVETLEARVRWGDYVFESGEEGAEEPRDRPDESQGAPEPVATAEAVAVPSAPKTTGNPRAYRRVPREAVIPLGLGGSNAGLTRVAVPDSGGLQLCVTVRALPPDAPTGARLPAGTRSVSVFLVNQRPPNEERAYRAFAFQCEMQLESPAPFVARPDLRGPSGGAGQDEWDEQVADLQYRDAFEYAVGHGVSATADVQAGGACRVVRTTWIPAAEVERVAPAAIPGVELGMEALGELSDAEDARTRLLPLVARYREWLAGQRTASAGLDAKRAAAANDLLVRAEYAAKRMESGIASLGDPAVLDAFRIANRAMARAARQRDGVQMQVDPATVAPPTWRPFQLAYVLLNLPGIADPLGHDRGIVDLLFFPTGGGKTEAYLGLAAFTMVLRRLRHPGVRSAGVSVLMRYTLRLLTLDQLGRAAALMCALELEREKDRGKLGDWPFEIGLWVGSAATPNRMGHQGYHGPGADNTAYVRTRRFATDDRNPAPIPIENCPWCGTRFNRHSFRLTPNSNHPRDLRVHCADRHCAFSGDRALPILGVDEPIYRRLPAFLIATVDKFAALPWTGEVGALFGLVDRHDQHGFYGPCTPNEGRPLGAPLPPPDLIIQDELHLISGPLGTIAGVYEAAIEGLACREVDGRRVRPKIIASTATVRRAESQIRALFDRRMVEVFPPAGPDRRDSFFAVTQPAAESPARLYVGIAAQGRSLKVVLLRASLALLSAGQRAYEQAGGHANRANPADPYMTLLGYFNSLRELGGSRRIVEDEVRTRVAQYGRRRRLAPADALFVDRAIGYDVLELTSRVSTDKVAAAKRRLALPFHEDERVHVALATNMISVGLDILRLGLMVVLGQPKTSAEYIQATSRVGRDPKRPGLVVTLLNVHKPRDRSHYERFEMYHRTFYRAVEATSVTPFSPRALDRALVAALVGFCRHGRPEMAPAQGAGAILMSRASLDAFAVRFAERARDHRDLDATDAEALRLAVLNRCTALLDDWFKIAHQMQGTGTKIQYQQEVGGGVGRLIYDFLHPDLQGLPGIRRQFRANRSMRDVEPSVDLTVKNLNDWGDRP